MVWGGFNKNWTYSYSISFIDDSENEMLIKGFDLQIQYSDKKSIPGKLLRLIFGLENWTLKVNNILSALT